MNASARSLKTRLLQLAISIAEDIAIITHVPKSGSRLHLEGSCMGMLIEGIQQEEKSNIKVTS